MYPVLFHLGPITLYSFGLMMAAAFLTANYFFTKELARRGLDIKIAGQITIIALIGGVAGSKLFSVLENWQDFSRDPMGQLFSPAGLTFYGGFIVVTMWIYVFVKRKRLNFRLFADMLMPTLLLAYGIGRIGCQLAGDGDYGIPSSLPWAMTYPQGTAKPSVTLIDYYKIHPEERSAVHYDSLSAITVGRDALGQRITAFDEIVRVHPAPVYETLFCVLAFVIIWIMRKRFDGRIGSVFALTMIVMGVERLMIEFIRINPLYWGLSMAQWISIGMILIGSAMLFKPQKKIA